MRVRLTRSAGTFVYPMRVAGYLFVIVNVYLARLPEREWADLVVWLHLMVVIVFPHIAFYLFTRHPSTKTELYSLHFDMVLIGITTNLLYFNPVLFLPFLISNSSANYAMRGPTFMFQGVIAYLCGLMLSFPLLGFEFRMTFSVYELIPAYFYLIAVTHYVGYISYVRGIVLIKAKKKAEVLANLDALTKIANRRRFDGTLEDEWQRSYDAQEPISMLALDIDYFKAYNDIYGHPTGDDCLNKVAQEIASKVTRSSDLVARTGGEEFSIILSNTSLEKASDIAQTVLKAIQGLKIEHNGSKISAVVTVSIGVVSIVPVTSFSPRGLMLATDQALYQAKKMGRNCICTKKLFAARHAKAAL